MTDQQNNQDSSENTDQNESVSGGTGVKRFGLVQKLMNPSILFSKASSNPLVNQGYVFLRKQKYDEAMENFKAAISEDKLCQDAHVGAGKALAAMGGIQNAKKSIVYFNNALKIDPSKLSIYQEIINVYERLGDKKNAAAERKKQFLAKTLKANPNDSKANNNMGVLQLQQKNVNAAIKSFKKAIRANKSFLMARSNLASAFLQKAQKSKDSGEQDLCLKQGLGLINQVLEKQSTAEANLIKAKILLQKGDAQKASEHCTIALSIDPALKEAYNTKRAIEEKLGNVGEANIAYDNYQSMKQSEQKVKKEKIMSPFD